MDDAKEELAGTRADDVATEPREAYEPPSLILLGTLEALTQGIVPLNVDSVLPGSQNP